MQHLHDNEFDHPRCEPRIHHSHHRNERQVGIRQEPLDAGAQGEDGAQVVECGEEPRGRVPCQRIIDLLHSADDRPETQLEVGKCGVQGLAPGRFGNTEAGKQKDPAIGRHDCEH